MKSPPWTLYPNSTSNAGELCTATRAPKPTSKVNGNDGFLESICGCSDRIGATEVLAIQDSLNTSSDG